MKKEQEGRAGQRFTRRGRAQRARERSEQRMKAVGSASETKGKREAERGERAGGRGLCPIAEARDEG